MFVVLLVCLLCHCSVIIVEVICVFLAVFDAQENIETDLKQFLEFAAKSSINRVLHDNSPTPDCLELYSKAVSHYILQPSEIRYDTEERALWKNTNKESTSAIDSERVKVLLRAVDALLKETENNIASRKTR